MEFGLLGALEIWDGARRLDPGPPKHRVVLAAFLANPGRVVGVDRLIGAVWDDDPPRSAESALRVYVSALRKLLGGAAIRTVAGGYLVAISPDQVDVGRFEDALRRARQEAGDGRLAEAGETLRGALGLWRGPALADIESAELRRTEAVRLEELRNLAVEQRLDLDLRLGRHHEVVGELRGLVAEHPLRERLWAQLMQALQRAGRRAEALEAYHEARRALADELGLDPGEELRDLHQRILSGGPPAELPPVAEPPPAAAAAAPIPRELPADVADFTGRAEVLTWIRSLADPDRSPTAPVQIVLHGPPGVGKSALAVHAAAPLEGWFPDGTLHAELRGADARAVHPTRVLAAFLRSLGRPDAAVPADFPERAKLYRSLLAGRRMLIVLDDAVNEAQVRPLLPTTPGCVAIITGRSPLAGLAGARKCAVGVLSADNSLTLLQRVAGADRVAAEPAAARRIVTLCDRLPLAIRIAGARLADRPAWPLARLAGMLADERRRLDELQAGDLAVRGSIELGYQGLAAAERRLLRRLGALSVPDFASWVAGPLLAADAGSAADSAGGERAVEGLVDAGLAVPMGPDLAGQDRYRLHDLVHLYARDRFRRGEEAEGAAGAVLGGLARRALALTREAGRLLVPGEPGTGNTTTPDRAPAPLHTGTHEIKRSVDWLAVERAFLVSLVADLEGRGLHEATWRLAYYLAPFFEAGAHHDDWRATHEPALRAAREHGHRRGEALLLRSLGDLHRAAGRSEEAREALTGSITLFGAAGERVERAHSLRRLGLVHLAGGRLGAAEDCLMECLAAFGDSTDPRGTADTLLNLGAVLRHQGRPDEALDRLKLCMPTFAWLADRRGEAATLRQMSLVHLARGDLPKARQLASRALRIGREIGDRPAEAAGLTALSGINLSDGRPGHARRAADEALRIAVELADRRGAAHARLAGAAACLAAGAVDAANELLGPALAAFAELGDPIGEARARRMRDEAGEADTGHARIFSPSIVPRAGT